MENGKDRSYLNPESGCCRSTLRRQPIISLLHFYLLAMVIQPVFLFSSCNIEEKEEEKAEEEPIRTIRHELAVICPYDWVDLGPSDLFIYSKEGTGKLLLYEHYENTGETLTYNLQEDCGPCTGVLISNCPFKFKLNTLDRMDSMQKMTYKLQDEDKDRPICSGVFDPCETTPGYETPLERVDLQPLMCRVILESISNGLDLYRLLESPSVWLSGASSSARVLQIKDFRPEENDDDPEKISLDYDVGFFTQYPGTVLCCYPNDTPENILGVEKPELVFECTIDNVRRSYRIPLPPLQRGSTTKVNLVIDSEETHYYHFSSLSLQNGNIKISSSSG